jgi:hypothetical protein
MVLAILLGLAIVGIPAALRGGPYIVTENAEFSRLAESRPWEVSVARIEGFTRQFLQKRFEWNSSNFDSQKERLALFVTAPVLNRLKDSLNAFRSIAHNQGARCFYVLKRLGFSNSQRKIKAHAIRIIRIGTVATATPMTVRISYQDSKLTHDNPYGLDVIGFEEELVRDPIQKEGKNKQWIENVSKGP